MDGQKPVSTSLLVFLLGGPSAPLLLSVPRYAALDAEAGHPCYSFDFRTTRGVASTLPKV
jgi:hypothetical protein